VKQCKTVVNKLDIIESTFRNFQLELLAGEENYIAVVHENDLLFTLDFRQVLVSFLAFKINISLFLQ
jgi:tRNA (guanine37-N1)-methyltransferase